MSLDLDTAAAAANNEDKDVRGNGGGKTSLLINELSNIDCFAISTHLQAY